MRRSKKPRRISPAKDENIIITSLDIIGTK